MQNSVLERPRRPGLTQGRWFGVGRSVESDSRRAGEMAAEAALPGGH